MPVSASPTNRTRADFRNGMPRLAGLLKVALLVAPTSRRPHQTPYKSTQFY
jgi:hypothetical protein